MNDEDHTRYARSSASDRGLLLQRCARVRRGKADPECPSGPVRHVDRDRIVPTVRREVVNGAEG